MTANQTKAAPEQRQHTPTEAQITHMVARFLGWKLPENFNPDGGITFKPIINAHTGKPYPHGPTGTNLFDAVQAEAMVRHMVEGLPDAQDLLDALKDAVRMLDAVKFSAGLGKSQQERLAKHKALIAKAESH